MSKKNDSPEYAQYTHIQKVVDEHTTSIALLSQSLEYMKQGIDEIKGSVKGLESKLENGFVKNNDFESFKSQTTDDINELKESRTWATRTLLGSIFASTISFITALVLFLFKK